MRHEGDGAPESGHPDIERRMVTANQRERAARAELRDARRERAFWEELRSRMTRGHVASALLLLRTAGMLTGQPVWIHHEAAAWLRTLAAKLDQGARNAMMTFPSAFPDAAAMGDLVLDRTSRYPDYTLKDGFVRVDVDELQASVTISPRDGTPLTVGADVDVVVQTLRDEVGRIFARPCDHAAFLRDVFAEYNSIQQDRRHTNGAAVAARDIAYGLGRRQRGYTADMFNVDLARILRSGEVTCAGRRLVCHHTRDVEHGMLLHGFEHGGYVGSLTFSGEEQT